jgi:hypothetical protein
MDKSRASASLDVLYYGRETRSSLGWLVLSLFLGGTPLAVYLTAHEAPISNLMLALIMGIPTFVMSLVDLGKARALVLIPEARRLRYIEGFFGRRTVREFSYDEVREVQLTQKQVQTHGGDGGGGTIGWWDIRIVLTGQREILLEETSTQRANRLARHLGTALGIHPLMDGKSVPVLMQTLTRPGTLSKWTIVTHTIFFTLGAVIIALCIALAFLRFLKH